MKKLISMIWILAFTLPIMGCVKDESPQSPVVIGPNDDFPAGKNYVVYTSPIPEISGFCYNQDSTALFVVSDQGYIYKMDFTGKIIEEFPFNDTQSGRDLEGITMNSRTGDIYVCDEALMSIFKVSTDKNSLSLVKKMDWQGAVNNLGLEGITYGRDTIYAVKQTSPLLLYKYSVADGKLSHIVLDSNDFSYLSDICYDATDHTLWIVDSKKKLVSHISLNGKLLGTQQSIDYIRQAEALQVDRKKKIMWIGSDENPNRESLYKVKLLL